SRRAAGSSSPSAECTEPEQSLSLATPSERDCSGSVPVVPAAEDEGERGELGLGVGDVAGDADDVEGVLGEELQEVLDDRHGLRAGKKEALQELRAQREVDLAGEGERAPALDLEHRPREDEAVDGER